MMARDDLLPKVLSTVHPRFRTPWVITLLTGDGGGGGRRLLPGGAAGGDYSNSGTLFAFAAVSAAVMILRFTDKGRLRPFRTPLLFLVAPLSILGCLVLFLSLGVQSKLLFVVWTAIGLLIYFSFGFWNSNVRRGVVDTDD